MVGIPVTEIEQERLALMGVHIVAAGRQIAAYPHVSIDDHAAGTQAMNHLLHLGHRRIAMIDAIDPNADEWRSTAVPLLPRLPSRAPAALDPDLS